jgi:hypothetical protein
MFPREVPTSSDALVRHLCVRVYQRVYHCGNAWRSIVSYGNNVTPLDPLSVYGVTRNRPLWCHTTWPARCLKLYMRSRSINRTSRSIKQPMTVYRSMVSRAISVPRNVTTQHGLAMGWCVTFMTRARYWGSFARSQLTTAPDPSCFSQSEAPECTCRKVSPLCLVNIYASKHIVFKT